MVCSGLISCCPSRFTVSERVKRMNEPFTQKEFDRVWSQLSEDAKQAVRDKAAWST